VFGQVTSGMEVVDAINNVPVGDDGPMPGQAPVDSITVIKVTVLK
jgi:cyclophilin family peptidyl-prolyl cis-trans isomerase